MRPRSRVLAIGLCLVLGLLSAAAYAGDENECIANGSFEKLDEKGKVAIWGSPNNPFEMVDGKRGLRMDAARGGSKFEWAMPDRIVWDADYILSYTVKSDVAAGGGGQGMRLCLWARLPDQHEPPNGPLFTKTWSGKFGWKKMEMRFRMPRGVSRFIIFPEPRVGKAEGTSWVTDISIRPADDRPLAVEASSPSFGDTTREQLLWIWSRPGFEGRSGNQGRDLSKQTVAEECLFRRTISCPAAMSDAQALFTGHNAASLSVNGKEVGRNDTWQDVVRVPLMGILKPGENQIVFKVNHQFGMGGLLGRVEWKDAGKLQMATTNGAWECSSDGGRTWQAAVAMATPVPAPTDYHWAYPHLELRSYTLSYPVAQAVSGVRIAVRATGSFRVFAGSTELLSASSSGNIIKADLRDQLAAVNAAKQISIVLEEVCQPPAGQASLELTTTAGHRLISLGEFRTAAGAAPAPLTPLYPSSTWPMNVAAFEAAASRPIPDLRGHLEPWAEQLLKGSRKVFQIGTDDNSSGEFADMEKGLVEVTAPLAESRQFPRGLEGRLRPEVKINFNLADVPAGGLALVLDVEDADAMVSSVGVFANGVFCGAPQMIGYDQVPGGRLTNRAWVVTLAPERMRAGANSITLRLLPSYYQPDLSAPQNQSEEYIRALNLRDRKENPYPTASWVQWDTIYLAALAASPAEPVFGRPVRMGTNIGYSHLEGVQPWREFILRDLSYLGMEQTQSPVRYGVWDRNQLAAIDRTDASLPEGTSAGDYQLSNLVARGIDPFLLYEPGRGLKRLEELAGSHEANVLRRYGKYFRFMEIGNEVDHPNYGFNAYSLAAAYATIQKQSVCGQALKQFAPQIQLMGEGWYHAWDFGVIDAQQRKEAENDPGFTENLSAHDYGKSYIIPAVIYHLLYGVNPPKPIWVTECGSYTANDREIYDFDINLRGNIAYASYIVQYLTHPYDAEMRHFSMFSAKSKDAQVLEKARCFRRLIHAYAMHGKPLPWRYTNPAAMQDRLVLINPVENDKAIKISIVNFSHESQNVDFTVTLGAMGEFDATRYADGKTVDEGTRALRLTASPDVAIKDSLAAGETIEYLIRK